MSSVSQTLLLTTVFFVLSDVKIVSQCSADAGAGAA